ncbi:T9SS type A sorting domain-containing protein [Flavobacterium sp. B17]|uniref:T9SS type A sorting domain-containing protein n=1 Tax=Flavobacterium sp. B17 TaxID=95618 RepID=UPI00034A4FCE|nr:T9SS type A sorting domain-containing protein [Flavobacterium sp. B17]
MKQIIISLAVLLSISFKSQNNLYVAWETTFDTPAEVAGWQFIDGNNNSNTWNVGPHVVRQSSTNVYTEVAPNFVLRHTAYIPNVTGSPANLKPGYENDVEDWAISPQIDLSAYSGEITLAAMIGRVITYNTTSASNNTYKDIFVYVSTPSKPVPSVSDFQAIRANIVAAYATNPNALPPRLNITNADYIAASNALFAQATADLSQYAGQKIYIGFWTNRNYSGGIGFDQLPFLNTNSSLSFQIDEMQIFATQQSTLSTREANPKSAVTIYPNPVTDVLYLKEMTKASVLIYNAAGQLVLNQTVNNGQVNVSTLPKGIYMLSISADGKSYTTKFIKK